MWLEEMNLEVSWDAEVLGFLELGNSLTPRIGEQKGHSLWPGRGHRGGTQRAGASSSLPMFGE